MSDSLRPHELYSPWNFPGQNTGVGSLSLLQGIFPTQGLNPDLPHCRRIFYQLSHKGSPRILDWVAYPFSSGSSWPRNWTRACCIAGGFFTIWTIRETLFFKKKKDEWANQHVEIHFKCHTRCPNSLCIMKGDFYRQGWSNWLFKTRI